MRGQVEGHDVDEHEEGAGDQQVDHVEDRPPLYDHLVNKAQFKESPLHVLDINNIFFQNMVRYLS